MIKKKKNSSVTNDAENITLLINKKVKVILESDSILDFVEIIGYLKHHRGKYLVRTSDEKGYIIFYNDMIKDVFLNTIRVKV